MPPQNSNGWSAAFTTFTTRPRAVLLYCRSRIAQEAAQYIPIANGTPIHPDYVEGLRLWRWKEARDLSVKEFPYALARRGGHLGRPSDRPPRWMVLWRGWLALQPLVEGLRLARLKRSG